MRFIKGALAVIGGLTLLLVALVVAVAIWAPKPRTLARDSVMTLSLDCPFITPQNGGQSVANNYSLTFDQVMSDLGRAATDARVRMITVSVGTNPMETKESEDFDCTSTYQNVPIKAHDWFSASLTTIIVPQVAPPPPRPATTQE